MIFFLFVFWFLGFGVESFLGITKLWILLVDYLGGWVWIMTGFC